MRWSRFFTWFSVGRGVPARSKPELPPEVPVDRHGQCIDCELRISDTPPRFRTLGEVLSASHTSRFVPAAVVAQKAKSVCDGIIAALEGLSTTGDELGMGVREFLGKVSARLDLACEARDFIDAAIDLADGVEPPRGRAQGFLAMHSARAKVLGFYTWNEDLRRAFRRDRFLQQPLSENEAQAFAAAIVGDPQLVFAYERHLARIARLTDVFARPSLRGRIAGRPLQGAEEAFFPASGSHETAYGSVAAFFAAVISGRCDLTPDPHAGFYAHQVHALKPLLRPDSMPEARSRTIGREYAAELVAFAAASLFAARESHVKQLDIAAPVMAALDHQVRWLRPGLTIEPLPSFYDLTADAFRFLRPVVEEGWGPKALDAPQLRRDGAITTSVGEGIEQVIAACEAARDLSRRELDGDAAGADVDAWRGRLASLIRDPDVTEDARGMVPIALTPEGQVRVLVFAGWELHGLRAKLTYVPELPPGTALGGEVHPLPVPLVREATIGQNEMLDRDELRAVCDRALHDPAARPAFAEEYRMPRLDHSAP